MDSLVNIVEYLGSTVRTIAEALELPDFRGQILLAEKQIPGINFSHWYMMIPWKFQVSVECFWSSYAAVMGDCNEFIIGIVVIYVVYKLMDCLLRLQKIECIAERYILVVGADCGFGYELSKRLDILGCRVIATCYCEERRRKLQAECSSRVVTYMMNITDSGCVRDTYNQIRDQLTTAKGQFEICMLGNGKLS